MSTPIERRDQSDIGDSVLRKFNYQHAYGVVLLTKMLKNHTVIKSIWCEQHEDLLEEHFDGTINAFQIKTKKSESGEWKLNDELFLKSIKRFYECDTKFPNKIKNFYFVSNAAFSKSIGKKIEHLSPINFFTSLNSEKDYRKLTGSNEKAFKYLVQELEVDEKGLFATLKKVELIHSLTERAFEDELCQRHISTLNGCADLSAEKLRKVSASLMSLVLNASSLNSSDPSRDWAGLTKNFEDDPYLKSKSISKPDVELSIREAFDSDVRFPSFLSELINSNFANTKSVLGKKLERGGLSARYDVMYRRGVLAEEELLDLATRSESECKKISQIENVVLGECDDSYLRVSLNNKETFGADMLIDVQDRLKGIAERE